MAIQILNDKALQAFLASVKAGRTKPLSRLSDGGGLYLTVTPGGKAVWRLRYHLAGKEQLFTLGTYPAVNLAAARVERERLKQQLLTAPMNLAAVRRADRRQVRWTSPSPSSKTGSVRRQPWWIQFQEPKSDGVLEHRYYRPHIAEPL